MHKIKSALAMAVVAGVMSGSAVCARGAALVQVSILGEDPTQGENTFTSNLNVKPGDTINYEVELQMALPGTVNGTHTITSLVSGTDGVTSLSFNLVDPTLVWTSNISLASVFNQGLAHAGTLIPPLGLTNIFGSIAAGGSPQGVAAAGNAGAEVIVGTGSVTFAGPSSAINGTYSTTNGGFRINNNTFRPSVLSGDPNGFFSFAALDLNNIPIISLTTSAPTGYGSSLGTVNITGSNGSYIPGVLDFSGTTSGYAAIDTFNPSTDKEEFALDVHNATPTQLSDILGDINGAGISGLSASFTGSAAFNPLFTDGGSIIYLTENPGIGATPDLGFNLANDTSLSGVTITAVAAVPEPASLALLGAGALALLARRRR